MHAASPVAVQCGHSHASYDDVQLARASLSSSDDEIVFDCALSTADVPAAPLHILDGTDAIDSDDEVIFATPTCTCVPTAPLLTRSAPRGCVADTT